MFKVIKILLRLAAFFAFAGLAFWLTGIENYNNTLERIEKLPDCDFRAIAESFWNRGQKAEALACLEYSISNGLPDAAACNFLRNKYLKAEEIRSSAIGRLFSVGRGFITGNVDGIESFGGAVVSDIILYGDLRDIAKELFINEQTDPFILLLSTAGTATTLFPPADGTLSLIKIAKKTNSLAKPLQKNLESAITLALKSRSKSSAAEALKAISPISDLSKRTKTWTGFSSVLKFAESPREVSAICSLLDKSPVNAAKLEQILFISGKNSKRAFEIVVDNSQKGMDYLYGILRKGPQAMKFAARHPALISRSAKNAYKAYPVFAAKIEDYIKASLFMRPALKWVLVFCLSAAAAASILPYRYIFSEARGVDKNRFRARAVSGALISCILIAAAITGILAARGSAENDLPHINTEGTENKSIMFWADAICDINILIDEDAYWNDSLELKIKAPIVKIGARQYAVCGFDAIGFGWNKIGDGGVFNLQICVSKRGSKAFSFSPKLAYSDGHSNIYIPLEADCETALDLAGKNIDMNDVAIFSKATGFKNSPVEISIPSDGALNIYSPCSDGDSIVLRGGLFYGTISAGRTNTPTCHKVNAEITDEFLEIPLVKPNDQTYYNDFMRAVSEISKARPK